MIFTVMMLALGAAHVSAQPTPQPVTIREGSYADRAMTVRVQRYPLHRGDSPADWVEIEARGSRRGRAEFGRLYVNTQTFEASASPHQQGTSRTMIGSYLPSPHYVLLGFEDDGHVVRVHWRLGGPFDPRDVRVSVVIDSSTGALLALDWEEHLARWSLPSGWHSGPLKRLHSKFTCDHFLAE